MNRRVISVLAVVSIALFALQYTPLAFLSEDASDFMGGLAVGLLIGAIFSWIATRRP